MVQKTVIKHDVALLDLLIEQFIVHCTESRGMSKATVKTRKSHLGQFLRYGINNAVVTIDQVSPAFIDDYFSYFQKTHSKNTANTGRRIFKSFLKWVIEYKEMPAMRPESIRLVRTEKMLPKALNLPDVLTVIHEAKHPQDRLMIRILLESGIRISELVSIRVEEVYGDAILINGKGAVQRTVYVSENLKREIQNFIIQNNRFGYDFLIQNLHRKNVQRMTVGTARLRIQKLFLKQDITMHPHQLRHTFAITLLKNGCDIVTIQRLLGHTDVKTTQIYLNVSDDYLRSQHKSYMIFT